MRCDAGLSDHRVARAVSSVSPRHEKLGRLLEEGWITHAEFAADMKAKRKYLTKRERAQKALDQKGLCGCGCGNKLVPGAIGEHTFPVALGNDEKPDALYNPDCADEKTNGLMGDKTKIAKVKRHRNAKTQYDKRKAAGGSRIKGAGFRKDVKKKMSGEVVKRP